MGHDSTNANICIEYQPRLIAKLAPGRDPLKLQTNLRFMVQYIKMSRLCEENQKSYKQFHHGFTVCK